EVKTGFVLHVDDERVDLRRSRNSHKVLEATGVGAKAIDIKPARRERPLYQRIESRRSWMLPDGQHCTVNRVGVGGNLTRGARSGRLRTGVRCGLGGLEVGPRAPGRRFVSAGA